MSRIPTCGGQAKQKNVRRVSVNEPQVPPARKVCGSNLQQPSSRLAVATKSSGGSSSSRIPGGRPSQKSLASDKSRSKLKSPKKVISDKGVSKTTVRECPRQQSHPAVDLTGEYNLPIFAPNTAQGRELAYSSPPDLRAQMGRRVPMELQATKIKASQSRGLQPLRQSEQMRDVVSGNFQIQPCQAGKGYQTPTNYSILDDTMNATQVAEMYTYDSPIPQFRSPKQQTPSGLQQQQQRPTQSQQEQRQKPLQTRPATAPYIRPPCWNVISPPGPPRPGSPLPGPSWKTTPSPPPRYGGPVPGPSWRTPPGAGATRGVPCPGAAGPSTLSRTTPSPPLRYGAPVPGPSWRTPTGGAPPPVARGPSPGAGGPCPGAAKPTTGSPSFMESSQLFREVERDLMQQSTRSQDPHVRAHGKKSSPAQRPYIMTDDGMVPADQQLVLERKVDHSSDVEHISRHMTGITVDDRGMATKSEIDLQDFAPVEHDGGPNRAVNVISSFTIGADITQHTKSVILEVEKGSDDDDDKQKKPTMDPSHLSTLIEEENDDIEKAESLLPPDLKRSSPNLYVLKKRLQQMRLTAQSMALLEDSIVQPMPSGEEPSEELQPEVVAALIHTEEQGLAMGTSPTQLYDYLFPQNANEPGMSISSAAPAPLQDVVIPTSVPSELHKSGMSEQSEKEQIAILTQKVPFKPNDSIFSESFKTPKIGGGSKKKGGTKKKSVRGHNLSAEEPPWGFEELQPIVDLVGAPLSNTLTTTDGSAMEQSMTATGIEYMLEPESPRHVSKVQLRGSQKPPWFPGYLVALPDLPGTVQISKSPDTVLQAAWRAVQPKYFPENSFTTA